MSSQRPYLRRVLHRGGYEARTYLEGGPFGRGEREGLRFPSCGSVRQLIAERLQFVISNPGKGMPGCHLGFQDAVF